MLVCMYDMEVGDLSIIFFWRMGEGIRNKKVNFLKFGGFNWVIF